MTIRIAAIALLASALSTAAIAQGGAGGGASAGGAAGGAPGSAPSGTAGVSPLTSSPSVGGPGIPGPTSGAGLPGGPGPGNTTVVPNLPAPPTPVPTVGSGANTGSNPVSSASSGRGSAAQQAATTTQAQSAAAADFHPEAVIDQSLAKASQDINAMSSSELRELVAMFDVCTVNQHPVDRQGKCGAAAKRYKLAFAKDRAIDRAIAELERVVRFQKMFRTTGALTTEFEDNINKRLRGPAALALATTEQSEQVSLKLRNSQGR